MNCLEALAEERIREAMERGDFANLPGAGKPLRLEDDSMVPEDLRVAYKVLRNAGCLPPEIELRKEILTLRDLIRAVEGGEERGRRIRELHDKMMKLDLLMKRPLHLEAFPEYKAIVLERLSL